MKQIIAVVALLAALVGSFFIGQLTVGETGSGEYIGGIIATEHRTGQRVIKDDVLFEVIDELVQNHFLQPSYDELLDSALDGALNSVIEGLDDPHTSYFDYEQYQNYQAGFGETYVGIGVSVMFSDGLIVVEEVRADGPADTAGIRPNDIIAYVDGLDVMELEYFEAISMILGDEGTDVTIGIIRSGYDDPIYLTMTRSVIDNSSVNYTTYTDEGVLIGYIEVTTFGDETSDKFADAIDALEALGIEGMVVDLRNNGGGHLGTVVDMMNEFLIDNGKAMFSIEYYTNGNFNVYEYHARYNDQKDYDIVTLINQYSASASEVFASAMQEQGGYTLLGTTSFGKGTMQTDKVLETTENDRLHISIGRWLTSDGNWVHFNGGTDGITPDIEVEPTDYEMAYKLFLLDGETILYDTVDSRVSNVQLILTIMGYTVREDGYFDQATKDAIEDIQTTNGLAVTGTIDEGVLAVLNDALDVYQDDPINDSQLQAAIQYLVTEVNGG